MLKNHGNSSYSWGEGKVYDGSKAKYNALMDGIRSIGDKEFRKVAASFGVSNYDAEMIIADYRASSEYANRPNTRQGYYPIDKNDENAGDINDSVE
jgi:hypothetical protein